MPIINSWNFPVFKGNLSEIGYQNQRQFVINTISPNSYGLACKNPVVKEALQKSDILILDGLYFGCVALFKHGIRINRITGWDAFVFFSNELNKNSGKVFFLGSSEETLDKIKKRYNAEYQNVEVDSYSPPFKQEFTEEDNQSIFKAINVFRPDVVFIGMTAPKQEVWAFRNKTSLDTKVICSVGNVFDWYAGNGTRPGRFWQKTGMEWLIRIFYRPEIFKRNIGNQMTFFRHLFLNLLHLKKME